MPRIIRLTENQFKQLVKTSIYQILEQGNTPNIEAQGSSTKHATDAFNLAQKSGAAISLDNNEDIDSTNNSTNQNNRVTIQLDPVSSGADLSSKIQQKKQALGSSLSNKDVEFTADIKR